MASYMSLPQSEADHFEEFRPEEKLEDTKTQTQHFNLILWLSIFIGLCTMLDALSLAYLGSQVTVTRPLGPIPLDNLPFLSSYSNLDDLYRAGKLKATPRGPTTQPPYSLTQVDSSAPGETQQPYPDQLKLPAFGMIPYNERRTVITQEISTVAEFFATDYGMENCSVVLTIPPQARKLFTDVKNAFFDVWALEWDQTIDTRRLTWNSKPPRAKRLGVFSALGPSTQSTEPYMCPSGTYQHIEVSCGQGPCNMHILASGQKELNGIYMRQYQTI
ncbi:hypothetical protein HYPSUDRAFT_90447 [Hypholoma sublateritium FD-334 SS-4]|uniref:Ubiquitin 3 binding protein But2 C-terminal domain-containing protein n=1 Tax=Hypholoma sublateritium (strain FD-334 SS-4) TaxID=945553 RepID=A0A0D2NFM4_HYPSF|nr:hypothetical protein HYPSUDRAFT_90447 [Hypholoma sublateritium FD-334 SS-4]